MTGEMNLQKLLTSMDPQLSDESYIFCVIDRPMTEITALDPWAIIREQEGFTAILETSMAKSQGISSESQFRRITLNIHSSLEAVGLTAAISSTLATAGISANVVAAFYHDHVFVPESKAEFALEQLLSLK